MQSSSNCYLFFLPSSGVRCLICVFECLLLWFEFVCCIGLAHFFLPVQLTCPLWWIVSEIIHCDLQKKLEVTEDKALLRWFQPCRWLTGPGFGCVSEACASTVLHWCFECHIHSRENRIGNHLIPQGCSPPCADENKDHHSEDLRLTVCFFKQIFIKTLDGWMGSVSAFSLSLLG